jgi:hypothetical protein
MVNCGYSVRFIMSRKENLNLLVERFPPTPSFEIDQAMKRTLKLIRKWKLTLCDKSRHKKDFSSISMMHDLLQSKGKKGRSYLIVLIESAPIPVPN